MIKAELASKKKPDNTLDFLEAERKRLEKTIERLNLKLESIKEKINAIGVTA